MAGSSPAAGPQVSAPAPWTWAPCPPEDLSAEPAAPGTLSPRSSPGRGDSLGRPSPLPLFPPGASLGLGGTLSKEDGREQVGGWRVERNRASWTGGVEGCH